MRYADVKLMAPGGTRAMAQAALEAGAESVFVGPRGWSRRPKSDELDDSDLRALLDYGRAQGKDIRVAINVMPSPSEMNALLHQVEKVAAWGAQGVMLCDPGCISAVRQRFPELEIHVSVTAGLFNLEDIAVYRELGADIIVLPYRWGEAEIARIRDQAGVALEAFLFQTPYRSWICPGRCYSSSYFHIAHKKDAADKDHFIGSASRGGSCHRICRSDWRMLAGDTPLDADLFAERQNLKASPELLLQELPRYLELGVTRLKIPGRERSVELVVAITRFYAQVLAALRQGDTDLGPWVEEWQHLKHRWDSEKRRRDHRQVRMALAG